MYATDLNLGTCWLGGTFNKGQFAEVMALKDNEILPIIIPVGYPSESRRGIDTFVRRMAGSKNRKAWAKLFFDVDFNTQETGKLRVFNSPSNGKACTFSS